MTNPEINLRDVTLHTLYDIGHHARDVLGIYAGRCQSRRLALDLLAPFLTRQFLFPLDPWIPLPERPPRRPEPDPVPWFNLEPLLDSAIGGALVALREAFPDPDMRDKATDLAIDKAILRGVKTAVEHSLRSISATNKEFNSLLANPKAVAVRRVKRAKKKR